MCLGRRFLIVPLVLNMWLNYFSMVVGILDTYWFFWLLANLINCLSMGTNYKPRYHHDHQNLHPTMLYPPLSFFDVMRGLVGSAT
jgi:hypothetical protein